ncbi:MAG: hypothetical protein QXO44_03910 [Thermoplasmatales archaeon]
MIRREALLSNPATFISYGLLLSHPLAVLSCMRFTVGPTSSKSRTMNSLINELASSKSEQKDLPTVSVLSGSIL